MSLSGGNVDSRMKAPQSKRTSVHVNEPSPSLAIHYRGHTHTYAHAHAHFGTCVYVTRLLSNHVIDNKCIFSFHRTDIIIVQFVETKILCLIICTERRKTSHDLDSNKTYHQRKQSTRQFSHKNPTKYPFCFVFFLFIWSDGMASSDFNFGIMGIRWNYSAVFGTKRG